MICASVALTPCDVGAGTFSLCLVRFLQRLTPRWGTRAPTPLWHRSGTPVHVASINLIFSVANRKKKLVPGETLRYVPERYNDAANYLEVITSTLISKKKYNRRIYLRYPCVGCHHTMLLYIRTLHTGCKTDHSPVLYCTVLSPERGMIRVSPTVVFT